MKKLKLFTVIMIFTVATLINSAPIDKDKASEILKIGNTCTAAYEQALKKNPNHKKTTAYNEGQNTCCNAIKSRLQGHNSKEIKTAFSKKDISNLNKHCSHLIKVD